MSVLKGHIFATTFFSSIFFCAGFLGNDPSISEGFGPLKVLSLDDTAVLDEKPQLWVLELDDHLRMKLRPGTYYDYEFFEDNFGYSIERHELRRKSSPKSRNGRTNPKPFLNQESNDENIKERILAFINKFLTAIAQDSGNNAIDESPDSLRLSVYFQGHYTSLNLEHGTNSWNYLITPPSAFPDWFYTTLPNQEPSMYIVIPSDVRAEFYKALYYLLNVFLRFPA